MSRIGAKNTTPELLLRSALWTARAKGWRVHAKRLPGNPDIVFPRWKVAVFVDGAFWHGHPSKFSPGRLPEWWEEKILANQERDRRADRDLRRLGWRVVRLWDFEVRKDPALQASRVVRALEARGCPPRLASAPAARSRASR